MSEEPQWWEFIVLVGITLGVMGTIIYFSRKR